MPKSINRKILSLLFVIAALMQFGSTKPMLEKAPDPYKPSAGTKITDLPLDCLCEIFQFFAKENILWPTLDLKIVCKSFNETIEKCPCFLTCVNGTSHFLEYQLNKKSWRRPESLKVITIMYKKNISKNPEEKRC